MWRRRSTDSQNNCPITKTRRTERYCQMMAQQIERVPYEDAARRTTMRETIPQAQYKPTNNKHRLRI
eukprot:12933873-Prorocentrum_lima.AAC.1